MTATTAMITNMTMQVQVFDPPMCCSTGVCGPAVDPSLVSFASSLAWLERRGVSVERANLGQNPGAFTTNPCVIAEINRDTAVLPLVLVNGEIKSRKVYPTREELAAWCGVDLPAAKPVLSLHVIGNER